MSDKTFTDGNGNTIHEGQRVSSYDFDGKVVYGILKENVGYEEVSEWYVEYDDGFEGAVLDEKQIFKV